MMQRQSFEQWIADVAWLDSALVSFEEYEGQFAVEYWQREYDLGKSPRSAVLDNYDGHFSSAALDRMIMARAAKYGFV